MITVTFTLDWAYKQVQVGSTQGRAVTAQCVRIVALCNPTLVIKPWTNARRLTNPPC